MATGLLSIGTTNEDEFLGDKTGYRRWLPVEIGKMDVEGIKKDVIQFWAEARELFNKTGIQFKEAEQLAHSQSKSNKHIKRYAAIR